MDTIVAIAFGFAESERCRVCGGPIYLCHNDDRDLDISTAEHTCHVEAARQKREDAAKGKDGKGDVAGKSFSAEPYSKSGKPLGSFRKPYWDAKRKEREQVLEARKSVEPTD